MIKHTSIGIVGEVTAPLNKSAALKLTRCDGIAANGAQDTRVGQLGLGGDDGVGDVVVDGLVRPFYMLVIYTFSDMQLCERKNTYAVLLLLDLNDTAILEGPTNHIRVLANALDELRGLEGRPEVGEVLELNVVPDVREGRLDDGALQDGGRGRDLSAGHDECVLVLCVNLLVDNQLSFVCSFYNRKGLVLDGVNKVAMSRWLVIAAIWSCPLRHCRSLFCPAPNRSTS